jgi:hypothetical protein
MADVKKMATRDGYGKGLVALGKEHADVVCESCHDDGIAHELERMGLI